MFLFSHRRCLAALYFSTIALTAQAKNLPSQPGLLSKRKITQQDRTFYKFATRPDIDAPVFDLEIHNQAAVAPGYWFVAPYGQLGQDRPGQEWDGPHIYDGNGELVWSGTPMFGYWNAFDFESRVVQGERMLTLLSNHEKSGFILNSSYEIVRSVPLLHGHDTKPNMHEFNVFDDGTRALLLTHTEEHTSKEVSKQVGFDGSCNVKYQGFREVKVDPSGAQEVIFEWDASHHIGLDEATHRKYDGSVEQQCTRGWDILHLNSVVKFPDGDYLLSARHTDAVYKISHTDGAIVWRLGGVKSDFVQRGWRFSRQHHALVHQQNDTHTILTMFDNGIGDGPFEKATSDHSRALIILLDTTDMEAKIIGEYKQPSGERTNARGSFQTLDNGNKFICWSYNSYMSEHAPDGSLVMEARIPIKLRSYRAFKHPWVGSPSRPPDIHTGTVSFEDDLITVIHVSWNGDTRTSKWNFYEIDEEGNVKQLGETKRQGFETRFEHKTFAKRVYAEAFDPHGNILAKSEVATTPRPSLLTNDDIIPEGEQEHAPLLQEGQVYDQTSASGHSTLGDQSKTFAVGLASGVVIVALAWAVYRFYNKRWGRHPRKGQEAHYMPLQEVSD